MFEKDGPTFWELAEQALSSTEHGYDLLAPKFDNTPFRTPDQLLAIVAAQIGPAASIDEALDVCCGTGAVMRFLRPLCRQRVVGVDSSEGMLEEAGRRLADAPGDAEVVLQRGDALALPFRDEFDVVTCFGAFGHILEADEPRFVRNVHQALRPGGRFVFVTAPPPSKANPGFWLAKGFNAAIRVRNAIMEPKFIMYYLTFLLPRARTLLSAYDFDIEVREGLFERPFHNYVLVLAKKQ